MTKFRFKPEDFLNTGEASWKVANNIIDKAIAEAPVVYGFNKDWVESMVWCIDERSRPTHKAVLLNIEDLANVPCVHQPTHVFIGPETGEWNSNCKSCGIKLKPRWEAAE